MVWECGECGAEVQQVQNAHWNMFRGQNGTLEHRSIMFHILCSEHIIHTEIWPCFKAHAACTAHTVFYNEISSYFNVRKSKSYRIRNKTSLCYKVHTEQYRGYKIGSEYHNFTVYSFTQYIRRIHGEKSWSYGVPVHKVHTLLILHRNMTGFDSTGSKYA